MRRPTKRRRAFSLVEMLAAVAILSMLALMGVPYAQTSKDRELEMALRDTLTRIRWAINTFAWNEYEILGDVDSDGIYGEDPAGDPDGDGIFDDDRDGRIDEDGPPIYPPELVDLVTYGYLSNLPRDPMCIDPTVLPPDTWRTIKVTREFRWDGALQGSHEGVINLASGSFGTGLDGTHFSSW